MNRTLTKEFEMQMKALLESINLKYDYDFRNYTHASMKRTLVQAMNRMGYPTLPALQEKVLHDASAFQDLLQSLTISVSEMFRDPFYFLALREKVIPLLKTYPSIKIWIAGCSTGEEAYSLAITLKEEGLLERSILYATDINSNSLEKAEKGIFNLKLIPQYEQNYQESGGKKEFSNYYTVDSHSVIIKDYLKKKITFVDHSLVTDAVFAEMHLISCRNVLIYFDRKLQDRALGLFYESLCRKGFLGLGSKETVQFSHYVKHFDPFVLKARIYQKR